MSDKKEKLAKLLSAGSGIQYVLDTADEIIGNPLIFLDIKYKLIARSKSNADNDPLWVEIVTKGRFSHKTVDFFKNAKFIEAYFASPIALMQNPELADRINGVVFDKNGVQMGNICLIACNKPLTEEDYGLVEIVCDKLTLEVQEFVTKSKDLELLEEKLIEDLIEGKTAISSEQDRQIQELNKLFKKNIYVAVVDTTSYEQTITHLVYFADLFKRLKKEFHYFTYLNNIVVLFSSDQIILNVEKAMKELNSFFVKYNIFAGVSSNMKSLYDLKIYFKEALNALNYGLSLESGRNIFSYDIFCIELFLNSYVDETDIKKLCHPIFFVIRDYDRQNKTGYLDALNTYFVCGLNAKLAAKKLKISTKEFMALLQDLAKMFEIDFNDGNMLFAIFRSIKWYKCFSESLPYT